MLFVRKRTHQIVHIIIFHELKKYFFLKITYSFCISTLLTIYFGFVGICFFMHSCTQTLKERKISSFFNIITTNKADRSHFYNSFYRISHSDQRNENKRDENE